jgi:hypothetical protein
MVSAPCRIDRNTQGQIVRVEPLRFIHTRNIPNLTRAMIRTGRAQA